MSSSATEHEREHREQALKRARRYVAVTLFWLVFGVIYEMFSFGVYSNYMIYAFMFPLVGGLVFWLMVGTARRQIRYSRLFVQCQSAAIATFTLGFVFKGILDIYGTASDLTNVYWIAGFALAALAAGALLKENVGR